MGDVQFVMFGGQRIGKQIAYLIDNSGICKSTIENFVFPN